MTAGMVQALLLVLGTAVAIFLLGDQCGCVRTGRRLEKAARPRHRPDERPVPYRLTRAGYLEGTSWAGTSWADASWAGAADPAFEGPPLPSTMTQAAAGRMTLLSDGYGAGLAAATQAEVARDLAAIELEVEMNPERWQS